MDHYSALGVPRGVSPTTLKNAYQRLVLQHHPDKNSSATTEAFERIQQAYNVLKDPQSRLSYDALEKDQALREQGPLNVVVDLDDMEEQDDGVSYRYPCRCSGAYVITTADMDAGRDLVGCSLCSLRIKVLFSIYAESEEDEEGGEGAAGGGGGGEEEEDEDDEPVVPFGGLKNLKIKDTIMIKRQHPRVHLQTGTTSEESTSASVHFNAA